MLVNHKFHYIKSAPVT